MAFRCGCWTSISILSLLVTAVSGADAIRRSAKLRETAPWNLTTLGQAPAFEWVESTGPVLSLLYEGEPYGGKPTRVLIYCGTPGSLAGESKQVKNLLPAVVLIHGGRGTAFRDWAELRAKRGYAAIAMHRAGRRPIEGTNVYQHENRTHGQAAA